MVEKPQNPGIEIEKSTNGVDADTPDLAPEIAAGETVTWTYEVTNTGDVSFDESEVVVTDDLEGIITNIIDQGNGDNTLAPGETWIYEQIGIAEDLSTVTNTVIDFETDGLGNALPAGTIIDDEYQNLGVTISATQFGAMIFDSANPTGEDPDLATDSEGNILIISEDGDSSDPDDNAGGGVITFDLDNPVDFNSINFVDIEESGGEVRTTDADGNVTATSIPNPGNGSLQTLNINDSDVVKIEVDLVGSGAISGLDFDSITEGIYKNIGTVVADGVEDSDPSHYVNGEPVIPGIDIEKFTNGVDADTPDEAPEISAGETVTWTYKVKNTGEVSFAKNEIVVTDDQEGIITNIFDKGDGDDTLAPGETWIYKKTGIAQDLSTTTSSQDITFHLTGNSSTEGHFGNVRTFTQDGVSVDVSAFSSNKSGGDWKTAYLGAYSGGLGVTNRNEDGSLHRVDNGGSNDYILFEFDQDVTVDRALLAYIVDDSDISVWIGDRDGDISLLDNHILSDFTKENNNGGNGGSDYKRWANFNADELTGDTIIISARHDDHDDAFKLKKLDLSVPGETTIGNYVNIGTVTAGSVSDEDQSGYTNPEGEPENPDIDIEKFTNGVDADTLEEAAEIAPHETVTWTYEVTNTGDVPFDKADIEVTDDQEGTITNIFDKGDGDNTLAPGETWIYKKTGIAQDLSTTTSSQDITFHLTGNSSTEGHFGNVRTFTQDGVSVDVSAFSSNKSGGDWKTAYLGAYSGGLGVTNRNEDGSLHRVDNGGSNDYILFEFDQDVTVDRALLAYIVDDSDISVWIGDRDGDISLLDNHILSDFTKENNNGGNGGSDYKRWANFNADELTGDTIIISARHDDHDDAFKLKKLDLSVPGETTIGNYVNIGTVTAGSVSDEDQSGYTNPEGEPENPDIDIEKFTNGVDADTLEEAAEIAPHETVTWTYEVTNTGDVPFDKADIEVTDDQEGIITNIFDKGDGDNTLAPGETWIYEKTGIAEDLTTVTEGATETFNFTGNSGLDGTDGNIRTFDAGDLSVKASAFSRDEHGNWDEGFLGSFSSGLGVTDTSEGNGGDDKHKVDNVYRDNYVLFEFSEDVVVDQAFLDFVGADSDITYWVGSKEDAFTDHNILSDTFLSNLGFTEDNNANNGDSRWANINNGEESGNILVIAASTSDDTPEDRFKIKKLEVQQVETVESGFYQNLGTVDINGLTDEDLSHYVNPDFSI